MVRCDCAIIAVTFVCLFLVSTAVSQLLSLPEGATCRKKTGDSGKCTPIRKCQSEMKRLEESRQKGTHFKPTHCGFNGREPIVCCHETEPVTDATRADVTDAVTDVAPGAVTERKAVRGCLDLDAEITRNFPRVYHGREAQKEKFPHMVAVGYRDEESNTIVWECGGSLISLEFVLTAAHCILNAKRGAPELVRVGVHNLSKSNDGEVYRVLRFFVHPDYKVQSHYNDVALLKVSKVDFGAETIPACLYTERDTVPERMVVTGWGTFDETSRKSEVLLEADLVPIPMERCNSSYRSSAFKSRLTHGILSDMICARGEDNLADACDGDSGGPLQIRREGTIRFLIVGITSFGSSWCGGGIGVYVRVASYLDWIEATVWPD